MNRMLRKLRKVVWVFHEMMSPLGHVIWADHRIQEIHEAIEELQRFKKDESLC